MRKLSHTRNLNPSSATGIYTRPCEYEIHRLCQEQIHKQRQRKSPRIIPCRYLARIWNFSMHNR